MLKLLEFLIEIVYFCAFLKIRDTKIYRTSVLAIVLYGCETWSLTVKEERRLRLCENRVLRRIFGPKRDEVAGGWSGLHKEELDDLYCSPNIVRVIRSKRMKNDVGGACSTYGAEDRYRQGFGGETRGKETTWKTQA
jgi:hypothetical protein